MNFCKFLTAVKRSFFDEGIKDIHICINKAMYLEVSFRLCWLRRGVVAVSMTSQAKCRFTIENMNYMQLNVP